MIEAPSLLTHEFFQQLTGKSFRLESDGETMELRLEEVELLPPPRERRRGKLQATTRPLKREQPFSLLFTGPHTRILPQAIYAMRSDEVRGALEIFIVPVEDDGDAYVYEAVFG
jgi:hypothetical protein